MKFNGQTEEKWGLCFAGGGGKGAYEIGVWRALEECTNIKFSAVAGTSVGALNAILFATKAVDEAEEIWRGITPDKLLKPDKEAVIEFVKYLIYNRMIFDYDTNFMGFGCATTNRTKRFKKFLELMENYPFKNYIIKYIFEEGIFSRKGLEEIIKSSGVADMIKYSEIDCFATISRKKEKKYSVEYKLLNKMGEKEVIDTLLASSAIPFIYGKQEVDGEKCIDGGLVDNIPYEVLYGYGCSHIVVVNLDNPYMKKSIRNVIDDVSNKSRYQGMKFLDIYPKRDLKGLWGTLNFNPKNIEKLIEYGYEDTKEYLEELKKREII